MKRELITASQSPTLTKLLAHKQGCRNDDWGVERIWDLEEVIYHEMTALMRTDIPEFLNLMYDQSICSDEDGFDVAAFEEEAPLYVQDVIAFIRKVYGVADENTPLYTLWLSTKEHVLRMYHSGEETPLFSYLIPDDCLVISDLDDEGCLFVTTTHPDELGVDFEMVCSKIA